MKSSFLEEVQDRVLICDGAMGTEIYARGVYINKSFDELNLRHPQLIASIHQDYVDAGAQIVTTNTFAANRFRLAAYGLETEVSALNRAGAKLALGAAGDKAWVAGSIGPSGLALAPFGRTREDTLYAGFFEQAQALAEGGVHVLFLETFFELAELEIAFAAARAACDLPVVPFASFRFDAQGQIDGASPEEVALRLKALGSTVLGTNCGQGPQAIVEVVSRYAAASDLKIFANPNAGRPESVEGRTIYLASPEYMGTFARRLVRAGASVVGGCCGTTPAQIREMRTFVRSIRPARSVAIGGDPQQRARPMEVVPLEARSQFGASLGKKFTISVEVEPPRGLDPSKAVEGARILRDAGVDVVNIPDGPRAIARSNPIALAVQIKEKVGMEAVVHYCCRDRNLLGMQMDLIGAHTLGLNNLLAVTGDPPKLGTYPHATAVFDVDSIGLIHFVQLLNRGLDLAGQSLGGQTKFVVGSGCNPGAADLELEVERFGRKIEAGAEFFFSQPVFEPELLTHFLSRIAQFKAVPLMVGIMPLASARNAEFLHNEVPGMQIPEHIRARMSSAESRDAQRREGIAIAAETLAAVKNLPQISGAYIFPPFGRYEAVLEVLKVL